MVAIRRMFGRVADALKAFKRAIEAFEDNSRRVAASEVSDFVDSLLSFLLISPTRRAAIAGAAYRATYHVLMFIDSLFQDLLILLTILAIALYYYLLFHGAVVA